MGKKKKSFGEVAVGGAAIAGAALGAAAVFLSDKKNQQKIKKTVDTISDEAVKIGKSLKAKAEKATTQKKAPAKKIKVTSKKS